MKTVTEKTGLRVTDVCKVMSHILMDLYFGIPSEV
jgi:hypothetical protein